MKAFLNYSTAVAIFHIFLASTFCMSLHVLDTITPDHPIKDGDLLLSGEKTFALGFFSPGKSHYRYVGIWYYKVPVKTVVWVANRDNPINDTSGILTINSQGNLVIYGENRNSTLWSANASVSSEKNSSASNIAKLLDVGNLVLLQNNSTDGPRLVILESGTALRSTWHDQRQEWVEFDYAPKEWCDNYGSCGANGNCDPSDSSRFECVCLPGFEPRSRGIWDSRDTTGGCVRKHGARTCRDGEGFLKVANVKLPDTSNARVEMGLNLRECGEKCMKDCNCTAYTNADETRDGVGCLLWHDDLIDMRTFINIGQDIYIRVDAITLAQYARKSNGFRGKIRKLLIVLCSLVVFFVLVFVSYWVVKRKRGVKESQSKNLFGTDFLEETELDDSTKDSDVPLFDLHTIAVATANFSIDNKLGQGGFGSVYKGILSNGKEIAVKRLAKYSGQGSEEFKNEVLLIAKLQHRNLVRILGCCIQEEEMMIVYEYLPNKSLDSFIFGTISFKVYLLKQTLKQSRTVYSHQIANFHMPSDEAKRKLLDWRMRFDIICGIARGILYLHQDSILRIIHRDLKASNVLLDAMMNPKIADFGLARIFGGDQIEACTNRVVGTYGYMAPEYAMEGFFSNKSDVYSFGVLMLEIITGKKNTGCYKEIQDSNLVGHVWELWREGRASEIVDPFLDESVVDEALRCLQIGLLSVQEHATDRPIMLTVVLMLGNDSALPSPKQPAFIVTNYHTGTEEFSFSEGVNSINIVTCTMMEAR
ncbi:hypothetical protein TIFTF001_018880 [Ficus carica]|uniref:Receptor-like serine/threonine-protein kinase n=1 Tax=Ficus carica TaxID=3494 RepID=A0AA88AEX3_FICCA|nr:hypothetical protein TIFTF001_018880 [Ficus carica]